MPSAAYFLTVDDLEKEVFLTNKCFDPCTVVCISAFVLDALVFLHLVRILFVYSYCESGSDTNASVSESICHNRLPMYNITWHALATTRACWKRISFANNEARRFSGLIFHRNIWPDNVSIVGSWRSRLKARFFSPPFTPADFNDNPFSAILNRAHLRARVSRGYCLYLKRTCLRVDPALSGAPSCYRFWMAVTFCQSFHSSPYAGWVVTIYGSFCSRRVAWSSVSVAFDLVRATDVCQR